MYQVKKHCRSEFVPIRTLRYHVQVWGEPAPSRIPLVLVHGWMDVAASYQFMVDALAQEHYVIAPDWRGYGRTDAGPVDHFWFADYLADLEFLLDHYAPQGQVNLVGHSLGGNVAMIYSGIRPERIRRLVNLEGFGMPATQPEQAPGRYRKWISDLKQMHSGELGLRAYDSLDGVARRLMKTNPRLTRDKALWLAQHWASADADGRWSIRGHAGHKVMSAHLYQVEEMLALYRCLSMPVLSVEAADNAMSLWWKGKYTLDEYHERLKQVAQVEIAPIAEAGHMMHHDQPEQLAALIERFIA
ncbi:MAG: alpha/beta fold hydrolase [Rhodoferax sp.]